MSSKTWKISMILKFCDSLFRQGDLNTVKFPEILFSGNWIGVLNRKIGHNCFDQYSVIHSQQ